MADKRLDQTTNASAVAAADNIPFVTAAGVTSYVTGDEMAASGPFSSRYKPLASDRLWLSPQQLTGTQGSPSIGTLGNATNNAQRTVAMLMDADTVELVMGQFVVPTSWTTADLYIWWSNAGAGSGDVRWQLWGLEIVDGNTTDSNAVLEASTVTAPSQYVAKRSKLNSSAISAVAGRVYRFGIQRLATDAGDTLTNDAGIFAVELVRAS